jgi:hypothetical protein
MTVAGLVDLKGGHRSMRKVLENSVGWGKGSYVTISPHSPDEALFYSASGVVHL